MYQNEQIQAIAKELQQFHLPRWEELPDFDVYMDQLITLINRYVGVFCMDDSPMITPSMVNNYVKLKIMPKPEKKKYQRIHIAYLVAITLLKQVLTIAEIRDGIELQAKISGLKGAYNLFCVEMEHALMAVLPLFTQEKEEQMALEMHDFKSENIAIKLCTLSLAGKLMSKIILEQKKDLLVK